MALLPTFDVYTSFGSRQEALIEAAARSDEKSRQIRDELKNVSTRVYDADNGSYAVVQVNGFSLGTTRAVKKAVSKIEEAGQKGIILDLRDNGGGDAREAQGVVGIFSDSRAITTWAHGVRPPMTFVRKVDLPLVVLVNAATGSAAEYVASVLKDSGRAVIVGGSRTFGKGTAFQSRLIHDKDGNLRGVLSLTTGYFFSPTGTSVQKEGVRPHIVIPGPGNRFDSIFQKDMPNSLPEAEISPEIVARYGTPPGADLSGIVLELKKRSAQRLRNDRELLEYGQKRKYEGVSQQTLERLRIEGQAFQLDEAMNVLLDLVELSPPTHVSQ